MLSVEVAADVLARLPNAEAATTGEVVEAYLAAATKFTKIITGPLAGPVVDGTAMTAPPMQLVDEGRFRRVPILVGSNRDEMAMELCSFAVCRESVKRPD